MLFRSTSTKAAEQSGQPIHWVPMMSLPGILGHSPDTIPKQIPYLSAEPDRVALWGDWLGTNGFRIGINWNSGQPMDGASAGSDISLHEFSSLAAIPGVRLISLQGGAGSGQVAQVPFSARIEQPTQGFNAGSDAFIDTAAMMMSLDLIVTCDTSIAHLAGALGRTVFTALPHVADWRWLRDSDDTPWYPTMRLFRQTKPGDWSDVFARIATAVAERASAQQR